MSTASADPQQANMDQTIPFSEEKDPSFSSLLDQALRATTVLREAVERHADDLTNAAPTQLYQSALRLQETVDEVRPVIDRVTDVILHARHHTIESAYRALLAKPARREDAETLRSIMVEYHRAQTVIASSSRAISDAMAMFRRGAWAEHTLASDSGEQKALLGKA